jgi:DNA polymerase II small subunit/DNA polymerase delta subunit B
MYRVYKGISDVLDHFESFLDKMTTHIDVDVMPGHLDFSSSFLPQ